MPVPSPRQIALPALELPFRRFPERTPPVAWPARLRVGPVGGVVVCLLIAHAVFADAPTSPAAAGGTVPVLAPESSPESSPGANPESSPGIDPGIDAGIAPAIATAAVEWRDSFVLDNGLTVAAVSRPGIARAAAVIDVGVGSADDPDGREGLAHFVEHLLFLGNERYPDVREDQAFFAAHRGRRGAYTAFEHTVYRFEVDADRLEPALDRLGGFFVAPLLLPERIDAERAVIQAEYETRRRDDRWRLNAAFRRTVDPRHPYARFVVGSSQTLADRPEALIRDDVARFIEDHYAASRMTLAVVGPQPLPVLRQWVSNSFSDLPRRGGATPAERGPLFSSDRLPARLDAVPLRERRSLSLRFPVPTSRDKEAGAPLDYIATLVTQRGAGSLVERLRELGWAESVDASVAAEVFDQAVFRIGVGLTREGVDHADEIVGLVFAWLDLVRDAGVEDWRFQEMRLGQARGQRAHTAPFHQASDLARRLHRDLHDGAVALDAASPEFDPVLIRDYLGRLSTHNVLVTVVAPEARTDQVDPWFGTAYRHRPVQESALGRWLASASEHRAGLALPGPNPYLLPEVESGSETGARPTAGDHPVPLHREPGFEAWYQHHTVPGGPQVDFLLALHSTEASSGPREAALAALYAAMVADELAGRTAAARDAGLGVAVYPQARGLMMRVTGPRAAHARLVEAVLPVLRAPGLDEERFAVRRDVLRRQWTNAAQGAPHRRTTAELQRLLVHPRWSTGQRLAELETIALEDLEAFGLRFWQSLSASVLVHGAVDDVQARRLVERVRRELLPATGVHAAAPVRVASIADERCRVRTVQGGHEDAAVTVYVQGAERSDEGRAAFRVIADLLAPHFFHELRTEQHSGYVVSSAYLPILDAPGALFVVQSPDVDPVELVSRIQAFLRRGEDLLHALPTDVFDRSRAALRSDLLQAEYGLTARSDRYWVEIDRGNVRFDSREREAHALDGLDAGSIRTAYRRWFIDGDGGWLVVRTGSGREETEAAPASVLTVGAGDPIGVALPGIGGCGLHASADPDRGLL